MKFEPRDDIPFYLISSGIVDDVNIVNKEDIILRDNYVFPFICEKYDLQKKYYEFIKGIGAEIASKKYKRINIYIPDYRIQFSRGFVSGFFEIYYDPNFNFQSS